jgi:hypothetical protein
MGVSVGTAAEILTNPFDLLISVGLTERGRTWSYSIDRGPGCRCKRLIVGAGYASPEEVISAVYYLLTDIRVAELRRLCLTSDGDREFNDELVTWVRTELVRCRRAATWEKMSK